MYVLYLCIVLSIGTMQLCFCCTMWHCRFAAMPATSVSSSVAVYLLLASVCCFLSLSTLDIPSPEHHQDTGVVPIRLPIYIANIAMLLVMLAGILIMQVFIARRRVLTVGDHESSSRHKHHRKYSRFGVSFSFSSVSVLLV